ncbi:WGR domain-containing protein [Rhizobium sp. L1K21]|uniref:WGR domain-containing protein n=1 Tax=Rhizobium sp. L1K21 TaxID=2954933 RepID=UPI0020927245|nr:WGR domain-containing protein [Rhizobium sp. L1K21]MCO6188514.1 WGR domain-containing protein [Rhizobium sp. L1K21]
MIAQPYQLYIERKDASQNMARFYRLSIEPDLFGEICLIRQWGRIGAKGQSKVHHFESEAAAVELFLGLLRKKRGRGYRPGSLTSLGE